MYTGVCARACVCVCMCAYILSFIQLFVTLWIVAHQAPLFMEFSRQEYWSRLPFSIPGDLPDLESNLCLLCLLHLQVDSLPLYHLGGPYVVIKNPLPNAGDAGSIPELGKSPGEGNSNWLQYSCLANSKDRGVLQATVQFSSVTKSCPTLCTLEMQHARLPCPSPSPGICPNSCPLGLWCHPTISSLSSPYPPASVFPSIRVFSSESALHITWPKYWSFSYSIDPSNKYSGLISFRMDWFNLLAVQGTLKSPLQHHSSKASIIWWRRGWQRTRWLDGITYSMDMSLSKLQDRRRWWTGKPGMLPSMGLQRVGHNLVTK